MILESPTYRSTFRPRRNFNETVKGAFIQQVEKRNRQIRISTSTQVVSGFRKKYAPEVKSVGTSM